MTKLLSFIKHGFLAIVTAPFYFVLLVINIIEGIIFFPYYAIKALIMFFKGDSLFYSKQDRAIKRLKEQEIDDLNKRKMEAMNDGNN